MDPPEVPTETTRLVPPSSPIKPEPTACPSAASYYVLLALLGLEPPSELPSPELRSAWIKFSQQQNPERGLILGALAALCMFEVPTWCTDTSCHVDRQIYLSGVPYLPFGATFLLETALYLLLLRLSYLETQTVKCARDLKFQSWGRMILPFVAIGDSFMYYLLGPYPFRLAPYCRILLIGLAEPAYSSLASTCRVLPKFADILLLLLGSKVFYAWLFAMLFDDWTGALPRCGSETEKHCVPPTPSTAPRACSG